MATEKEIDEIMAAVKSRLGERESAVAERERAVTEREGILDNGAPRNLRDYFAGQALPTLIAYAYRQYGAPGEGVSSESFVAWRAYSFADAMLKARSK